MLTKTGWAAPCMAGLVLAILPGVLRAQPAREGAPAPDTREADPPDGAAEPGAADALAMEQQRLADKFRRLEDVLLRMAELTASTDPRRAALLRKAVAQSEERLIDVQFEAIIGLLNKDSLSRAIENQDQIEGDLRALLELLASENRAERIESEKARIRNYLKKLNRLIKQQKGLQGRTGGSGEPSGLAKEQGKLAGETGGLADEMKQGEEGEGKEGDEKEGDGKEGGGKEGEGKEGGGKGAGSEGANEGEEKGQGSGRAEGEGQGDAGDAAEGEGQGGRQGRGGGQESGQGGPEQANEDTARKRVEAARQRMEEARQELEDARREGAVERQEEAIRALEQAKADLEEILRQLREEEIERVLAMLEARFLRMLRMQRAVYEGTLRLDKVPSPERDHNHQIEASRLSSKEAEIVLETEKALALLREDGTAVAFPEAVEQMRGEMEQVVQRLSRAKVGSITQVIEEDIIAALEEMVEALEKAREDAEQRGQQPGQPPGQPQEPPLVDLLAELKMIRALQMRVNRRTERYSKLIEGEQAESAELLDALERLAERQERIYQVTRDLEAGKNR